MNAKYDVVVLGAGAAGLMCAMTAAARGCHVLLLERAEKVGKKILISGGGRCNFTNLGCTPDRFISSNPHFCKSALVRYGPQDFISLVEKHRIPYHEKTLGQLFCNSSAQSIVNMLLDECAVAAVSIRTGCDVTKITRTDRFLITTNLGNISAPKLVLATGGLSIPKMGATGFACDIAKQFNLPTTDTSPGLVPFTFSGEKLTLMRLLTGVTLEVLVRCGKQAFRENLLFTHRGLSGPAILQASSYWRQGSTILIDLLPGVDATQFLLDCKATRPNAEARTVLAKLMPRRLAEALTKQHLTTDPLAAISNHKLSQLGKALNNWQLTPIGSEGYAKAEVTIGGVATSALSSKTMESNAVPGLYVIGEAVDVTGWLGGYNFQWAWSSGWVAGNAI